MLYNCEKCGFGCMSKRLYDQHLFRCEQDISEKEERKAILDNFFEQQRKIIKLKYGS